MARCGSSLLRSSRRAEATRSLELLLVTGPRFTPLQASLDPRDSPSRTRARYGSPVHILANLSSTHSTHVTLSTPSTLWTHLTRLARSTHSIHSLEPLTRLAHSDRSLDSLDSLNELAPPSLAHSITRRTRLA